MAFIRSKTIKGNKYYYLVESKRVGGTVVQRIIKYLGANPTIPLGKEKAISGNRAAKRRKK